MRVRLIIAVTAVLSSCQVQLIMQPAHCMKFMNAKIAISTLQCPLFHSFHMLSELLNGKQRLETNSVQREFADKEFLTKFSPNLGQLFIEI